MNRSLRGQCLVSISEPLFEHGSDCSRRCGNFTMDAALELAIADTETVSDRTLRIKGALVVDVSSKFRGMAGLHIIAEVDADGGTAFDRDLSIGRRICENEAGAQ
jgi:hypothetical protein